MTRLIALCVAYFGAIPYALIGLTTRVAVGLVFWKSGRTKVDGWNIFHVNDKTLFLFQEEYRLPLLPPELAALAAQVAEHVLPAALIIGLGTRFAAAGLLVMTLVIQIFVYPQAYAVHATWAAMLLMLIKFGPGWLSLDQLLAGTRAEHPLRSARERA